MKVVDCSSRSLYRQDPKNKENLRREIRILNQLVHSKYVVTLYHVEVSVPAVKWVTDALGWLCDPFDNEPA